MKFTESGKVIELPEPKEWNEYVLRVRHAIRLLSDSTQYAIIDPDCSDFSAREKVQIHREYMQEGFEMLLAARQKIGF